MEHLLKYILILSIICDWNDSISQENHNYINIRNTNISEIEIDLKIIKPQNIEIETDRIITYYENNGYPFASVKLENIDIKANYADLIVNRGNRYKIDSLIIHGDNSVSEKKLYKVIQMKKGDIYNQSKINEINNLINRSKYLSQKREYETVFYNNTLDIYFYLDEIKKNQIEGLIGFNNNENRLNINGYANIKTRNILNMFEEIDLSFNAEQENFQKIETQISLPYLFNYKFGISTKLDIFREKENYTNVSTVSSLNYISKQDIVLSIKYQRKNSLSENNLLLNIKENNIGAGLEYRYKANELKISSFIVRSNISDESNASLSTTINSLNEIRVSKKIKVTIKSNSSLKFKKDLYDNEMLIFGGSNSLRGFNENEFKANKFIISSINISYDLDKKSDASIFYEQGFFEKRLYTEDKEVGWPRSIGTGVNIHTSSGKFYLQYAIGIYEDMRFNLQNGKVHIGIQNRF